MRNLEPTNTSQIARDAEFRSVSLVHWTGPRMTRYISISMDIYSSKSALQIYPSSFAWRIHATFGPLCLAMNLFFHILGWENSKSCDSLFYSKNPSWRPTWCNIYMIRLSPQIFASVKIVKSWIPSYLLTSGLPQPRSRANGGGNVYGFVSTGLHLRREKAGCSHSMEMDGNGMEKSWFPWKRAENSIIYNIIIYHKLNI